MTQKKARIKGTEFELEFDDLAQARTSTSHDMLSLKIHKNGTSFWAWLPAEWIELYDPPREEPKIGSAEQGVSGKIYIRDDYNNNTIGEGAWWSLNKYKDATWRNWASLQKEDGPTKPMKVSE